VIDLYECWTLAVLVLWAASSSRDRNALRIVLIASLASEVIVEGVTRNIHGAWKLAIPGAVETLTILSLLQWANNRTGLLQIACLFVAWLAHAFCYLDLALKTDIVYSRYETIIALVAIAQILVCYDTLARCGRGVAAGVDAVFSGRCRGVRHAVSCDRVASGGAGEVVQAGCRTEKTI
jgi:hypothetical protein